MNADAFRQYYDYHFSENRKIWDRYVMSLSDEQFTQESSYSHGSVRSQILHLIDVDEDWFSDIRGSMPADNLDPVENLDREKIRVRWDAVEQRMREYLAGLRDEMLFSKPIAEGEDKELFLWQVLLHVANHGTDHRAQILRLLNDLSVKTESQDYIFYVYDHP